MCDGQQRCYLETVSQERTVSGAGETIGFKNSNNNNTNNNAGYKDLPQSQVIGLLTTQQQHTTS